MRILREEEIKKEPIPVSFLTDLVSKGWEEVGYLKDASAAIKDSFTDTSKVEELMQDLMDAYLVFIGQVELYLDTEKDISPEAASEEDNDEALEASEIKAEAEVKDDDAIEKATPELPEAEVEIEPIEEPADMEETDAELEITPEQHPAVVPNKGDAFEFFVDFDEPDMSQPRLSDDEIYGHEDSEYEQNRLRSLLNG